MRTTVSIDDDILATAKRRAEARGMTLGEYLEEGARRLNAHEEARPARRHGELPVIRSGGYRDGLDLTSNRVIWELAYAEDDARTMRIVRGEDPGT